MPGIAENLKAVRAQMDTAERKSGRNPDSVHLLAVSKTWPAEAVREAYTAGQRDFGENYVQEGVEKVVALTELPDLVWHFIGPLQSNKTRLVAEHFHWVHSIDRLKIAQRLAEQRDAQLPPLNVCLQVNVSGEASKSGVAPEDLLALARGVVALPRLHLRGLMCIPEPSEDEHLLASRFRLLVELRDQLQRELDVPLGTLSMGMSADMAQAIAAGSTLVRVGTAIFGGRPAKPAS
ncbi:YggS family pyridoxal phosphate-dependent enzyme [Uliginosibacterium sp. 31-16]|uniref:YggS family pyridoxal phosphate-dependent enzyme n=1 Tax=Uliginosibacterium sp. 31-16 TaxID=3068315 RepID=UPI00273F52AD|nr:YggS family pyridoxal phosphate-dependent enzyme [Uliginosibacterium sp. 31-16]MDP5238101.1 YggS family pyridoxal phosphate-dependent enzyme [Uliginosibacterium sp. 31-16]